jgi:hypothetical protein
MRRIFVSKGGKVIREQSKFLVQDFNICTVYLLELGASYSRKMRRVDLVF